MAKRAYRWTWTARIDPSSLPLLQGLARELGFVVDTPGRYLGDPSPASLLDSLAVAYERDPAGVKLALRVLGVTANPLPDDVRFHSDPDAE
jgi:hypothetical protein